MKKFGKTFVIVILLPLLYLLVSGISKVCFVLYCAMKNKAILSNLNTDNLTNLVVPDIYSITLIADIVMLLLLFLFFIPTKESLLTRCNLKKCDLKKLLYVILFVIGFTMFNFKFISVVQNYFPSYESVEQTLSGSDISIFKIITLVLLVPIFEEILFRGVIFSWLRKNFNIVLAVIVQALVFAIIHGNITQGIYTFLFGIILALINIYTDSLYGNIVAHCTFNLFGALLIPLLGTKINIILYILIALTLCIIGIVRMIGLSKSTPISLTTESFKND